MLSVGRDGSGAGAVDEEDFIQAFEDVPTVQVFQMFNKKSHFQPRAVFFVLLFLASSHLSSPSSFLPCSPPDLLQQGGRGGHDEDPRRAVRR